MTPERPAGLEDYGWDGAWERVRGGAGPAGAQAARVTAADRGFCVVAGEGGEVVAASDAQRSQAAVSPVTGDWVLFSDDPGGAAVIDTVLERRTAVVRRDPALTVTKQTLAANVDVVGVLVSLDLPPNAARIERFLVLAADSGAEPLIVLSKGDLLDGPARRRVRDEVSALAPGIDILETSAAEGWGLDELRGLLAPQPAFMAPGLSEAGTPRESSAGRWPRRTFVALGPSGVGKSTLLNALVGTPVLATGGVRGGDGAGRHTTVRRELLLLPGGGVLIDTPGLRSVSLWEADLALDEVFNDIAGRAGDCRFGDCTHRSEPGCAVQQAVAAGELDPARLERYQRLWEELARQSEARAERRRLQSRGRRGTKTRRRTRRRP
ncbi:MAG: ribosome small subunit-dependent GTPase A [bacterium]|nr:ribosome small subunit-dependent GTPase A [bacterium]